MRCFQGGLGMTQQRDHIDRIIAAALAAVEPAACVERAVTVEGNTLCVGGRYYDLSACKRLIVVGAGKGSAAMAAGLERVFGDRLEGGRVTVKYGHSCPLDRVSVGEAGHPLPDESGVREAARALEIAQGAGADDLVFCLISGGGSALWPAPVDGVTLADKQLVTRLLLGSGASIDEMNAVRKHLSRIKGGQLAVAVAPARLVCLMLSDVIGDRIDVIASGPACPDLHTFSDAWAVLEKYDLTDRIPETARDHLREGLGGHRPETPKEGNSVFERVQNCIVGSNTAALESAGDCARMLGYRPRIVCSDRAGDTADCAELIVREWQAERRETETHPVCLLWGGETTMKLPETPGKGGRNQHLALLLAKSLHDVDGVTFASFGTDGTDGPTDAAGGVVDGGTLSRGHTLGLDIESSLRRCDSGEYLSGTGALIVTGPTNTNVMDIQILLLGIPADPA